MFLKRPSSTNHAWEIFTDGRLSHLIDGSKSVNSKKPASDQSETEKAATSNANQWMLYVNCARFAQEQNMIAVQADGEIYYEVCKDIAQGNELLVWYGDSYLQFMGIPVSLKEMSDEMNEESAADSKLDFY